MKLQYLTLVLSISLGLTTTVFGQSSYPMLMSIHPVATQVGQTTEHEVEARYNLYGAYQILVTGEGVTGEVVQPEKTDEKAGEKKPNVPKIKVRFTSTPDAQPGVRDFRIVTPQGVSTIGQLVVSRESIIPEVPANDTLDVAQEIAVPSTVCGIIEKNEDVDYYKFKVEAGTQLSFHIRSNRLQNKIHDLQTHSDPILTIRTAAGNTLNSSDNFFFADPYLSHRFEQAGEYIVEVRDVRYEGNKYWTYSLEISDKPFVTNVYPVGLTRGSESKVELVGFQLPPEPVSAVTIPEEIPEGPMSVGVPMGGDVTNPVQVFANTLPSIVETTEQNNTFETAQAITLPAGISGRIESEADIDCYRFEAKKGEQYSFEVIARRLQSSMDSNLRILNDKGGVTGENDDARFDRITSQDSWIETWTAPADGSFLIEIRDLHLRGGADFVYYIRATQTKPYFTLALDTDKTILTPGTHGVIFARVERKHGFAGEVELTIEGLPDGVTASCGRILADGTDGCVVLTTTKDTPMGASNVRIIGKGTVPQAEGEPPLELTAVATPLEELYMPGGGRAHWPVEMHTVSVGEFLDIQAVKLNTTDIVLKPGESAKIEIEITRSPEFDKNITLDLLYRHLGSVFGDTLPKGVTIDEKNSQTLLTGDKNVGWITIKAADEAKPVEKQQVAVMANVALNFVMKLTYAGEPVTITVTAPPEAEATEKAP